MPNHATVLPFPRPMSVGEAEKKREQAPVVHRCAGGCDSLVSSPSALCLSCAAEDR